MITVSAAAFQKIKQLSDESGRNLPFRISIQGGGCSGLSYKFDFSEKDQFDHVITDGVVEVVVDKKSWIYLNGSEIDWSGNVFKSGFTIRNPQEKNNCSCGKSFGV